MDVAQDQPSDLEFASIRTGVIPHLPVELINQVIALVDSDVLPALCLVSSIFKEAAEVGLYRDLQLFTGTRTIKCLRTMSRYQELAGHVRTFSVLRTPSHGTDGALNPCFTTAFELLLSRALHNMPNLTSLTLAIELNTIGKYLHGCPFRVLDLTVSCVWDAGFAEWLEEQTLVRSFAFCGVHPRPVRNIPLSPRALPNLVRTNSGAKAAGVLVSGRPVRDVVILFTQRSMRDGETIQEAARLCALSTVPVRSLSIAYDIGGTTLEDYFRAMRSIPKYLPGLSQLTLTLQLLDWGTGNTARAGFCDLVSRFRQLHSLYIYFEKPQRTLRTRDKQLDIVKAISAHAPTLQIINIQKVMYFLATPIGWMAVEDLLQLAGY